jgi:murein DD-endopeptidase MepM/ murein hydrolase activator NlpD
LGNLIVIRCVDLYVTLSNLRNTSIAVKVGDTVSYRNLIATVGNTADNTFPHLHIQVNKGSRDGPAVPMLFEGFEKINRFIVRNALTNR